MAGQNIDSDNLGISSLEDIIDEVRSDNGYNATYPQERDYALALQLPFMQVSESMGNHDSKIVDAASVD
jgi:hypothetical protein